MKVLIALASSSGQISGVQRHALNLAACLLTRPEITEIHLVAAAWQQIFLEDGVPSSDPRLHRHAADIGNSAWSRNMWFYAGLPRLAAGLEVDIVHLAYPAPLHRRAFACPTVVTLHDLYPYDIPKNFGFAKSFFNRAVLRQCLSHADAIACVSSTTFARLSRLDESLAQKKAHVLLNAVLQEVQSSADAPFHSVPILEQDQPFLLCVAQHRRNKNILLVLRVFDRMMRNQHLSPHTRLLIVGIPGPETGTIKRFIATHGLSGKVSLLNGIPEAQLQSCYRHCSALLAPSITEGFGLPVAEGLLAGCRIVCSDIPAFREVGGNHCSYFTLGPGDEDSFAGALQLALAQPSPQPIDLPQFGVAAVAAHCMELYRSLITASPRPETLTRPQLQPTNESRSHT